MARDAMLTAVMVLAALAGCSGDGEIAQALGGNGGAPTVSGVDGGGAGTGGAGVGGSAPVAIGATFTREDHAICADWPICPDGIVAPSVTHGRVIPRMCRATPAADGQWLACGGCVSLATCEPFVGRCRAPVWGSRINIGGGMGSVDQILPSANCVAESFTDSRGVVVGAVDGFTICTGDANSRARDADGVWQATGFAALVCWDDWTPP